MSLNQLARSLSGSLDRLVLATLLPPAAFGLYAAGARLLLLGALVIQSATRIVYPRFFAAATEGPDALARLTRRTAAQMALVGGLGLALVVVAAQTLPLLLGAAFADAARIGVLLAASVPCLALQYPAADALTASGRQGLRTALYLCGAAGSVGLVAAGARWAGPEGAAAGAVLGQATLAALLWGALGLSRWRPT
jgi:O-antigen/teichoic acid export membrane protein